MWDGLFILVILCLVMAGASYLAGSLPLTLSLSSRHMRLISALGTGVLVGTALIVIIPEGIETLYSASRGEVGHQHPDRSPSQPFSDVNTNSLVKWPRYASMMVSTQERQTKEDEAEFRTGPDDGFDSHANSQDDSQTHTLPVQKPSTDGHDESTHNPDPHAWIGISLITGFILMYMIDTLPRFIANASSKPQRFNISLTSLNLYNPVSTSAQTPTTPTQESFDDLPSQTPNSARPSSTTIGLVIHAIADGIALGASSATTSRLTFIIFVALMLHKAPAAFGLTSVLIKQGLSRRVARAHLIVFSAAAPIGALMTWSAAHLLGYSSSAMGASATTEFATGVLLLFSAGTFLYVAMHTMQEAGSSHGEFGHGHGHGHAARNENDANGNAHGYEQAIYGHAGSRTRSQEGTEVVDALVTVGGMLLPLLTQFGHAH